MMSRSSLHLGIVSNTDPPEVEVLDSYSKAYGFVEVAMELWRLAGRDDRAEAIDDVIASSVRFEPQRLKRAQIQALRDLLDGLEQALIGTVTDDEHFLSAAKVEELRGHSQTLDFNESWGREARRAVREALVYVEHLRTITNRALATEGSCILFD
jgi:septum formation inhibitor-activating ATPase MinD